MAYRDRSILYRGKAGRRSRVRMGGALALPRTPAPHSTLTVISRPRGSRFLRLAHVWAIEGNAFDLETS